MNVVKEIQKINERELELGGTASWHDQYKDSAYIFVGGLPYGLTEGDVVTVFSQFGEVMDVNLPRDKTTGKTRGFGFLMYEDQRSTILAVDNLNGAQILDRTIRVDHVNQYKQPKEKDESGEWKEREEQSLNARPEILDDDNESNASDVSSLPSIDPEDPMRDYLLAKRKEESSSKKKEKAKTKGKGTKRKRENETPEERRERRARKRAKKERERRTNLLEAESSDRKIRRTESPTREYRSRRSRSVSPRRERR